MLPRECYKEVVQWRLQCRVRGNIQRLGSRVAGRRHRSAVAATVGDCLDQETLGEVRRRGEDNRFSILDTLTSTELAAASATRWGGAVGVGWEYGFAPNWSAGIEYDHLFMGHSNNSFSVVNPNIAAFLNDRISQDVDMVTVRINYRFGGYGAPVAARY